MPSLGEIRSYCEMFHARRTAWVEFYLRKHKGLTRAKAFAIADAKVRRKETWPPNLN